MVGPAFERLMVGLGKWPRAHPTGQSGAVTPKEAQSPPFKMKTLRAAIPPDCFQKSLAWSMFYWARDMAMLAALYNYRAAFWTWGGLPAKLVWWNLVGFFGWAVFVVGHDCGHGTFSRYAWVNQIMGHCAHAILLVPFNGWAKSHKLHHLHHNDADHDHSWRPFTRTQFEASPVFPVRVLRFTMWAMPLLFPMYLVIENQDGGFSGNHFNPWSKLFVPKERVGAACSALTVLAVAFGLCWHFIVTLNDPLLLFKVYFVPYFVFVTWLDVVTYLQHMDEKCLYFRGEGWSFMTGALSTYDRTYRHLIDPFNIGYGRVLDDLHHNISDCHVVHHLFPWGIPHYHLVRANDAVRRVLGKHYRWDPTPVPVALYRSMRGCCFVEDEGDCISPKGWVDADERKVKWFGLPATFKGFIGLEETCSCDESSNARNIWRETKQL